MVKSEKAQVSTESDQLLVDLQADFEAIIGPEIERATTEYQYFVVTDDHKLDLSPLVEDKRVRSLVDLSWWIFGQKTDRRITYDISFPQFPNTYFLVNSSLKRFLEGSWEVTTIVVNGEALKTTFMRCSDGFFSSREAKRIYGEEADRLQQLHQALQREEQPTVSREKIKVIECPLMNEAQYRKWCEMVEEFGSIERWCNQVQVLLPTTCDEHDKGWYFVSLDGEDDLTQHPVLNIYEPWYGLLSTYVPLEINYRGEKMWILLLRMQGATGDYSYSFTNGEDATYWYELWRDGERRQASVRPVGYYPDELKPEDIDTLRPIIETWTRDGLEVKTTYPFGRRTDRVSGTIIDEEVQVIITEVEESLELGSQVDYFVYRNSRGVPFGVAGLAPVDWRLTEFTSTERPVEMRNLYLASEARGVGLGKTFLKRVLERAKELGYTEIIWNSGPRFEETAWGFYTHLFGDPVGVAKDYYGDGYDAKVWRVKL